MKKILVIDDDESVLDAIKNALNYGGYEVAVTGRSTDTFKLLHTFQPGLVLIDFMLDGANGGEICHQIKMENPLLPVVIISAYSRVFLSLGNYGCDATISKPFGLDDLLNTVSQLMPDITFHE